MWNYEKRLQYPVNIKNPDGRIAQIIMSQYGGPGWRDWCIAALSVPAFFYAESKNYGCFK